MQSAWRFPNELSMFGCRGPTFADEEPHAPRVCAAQVARAFRSWAVQVAREKNAVTPLEAE
jgi:hypothetical protein